MAKGTFLAHNVAWAVLGEKMNHRSQASANSNSGAWPFSATAASNYVTAITSAKEKPPSHPSAGARCLGVPAVMRVRRRLQGTQRQQWVCMRAVD